MSGCKVFHSPIENSCIFYLQVNKQTQIKSRQASKPEYPLMLFINRDVSVWELWSKSSVSGCTFLTHAPPENREPALVVCGSILFMFMMIECAEVALFFL